MDLLRLNTLRGTKTMFLKKHPCLLLWDSPPPPPYIHFIYGLLGHYKNMLSSFATAGQTANQSQTSQCEATLEEWLDKWNKRQKKNESTESSGKSAPQSTYTLSPGFPPLQELSPSLLPPPPSGYPELPRVDWGYWYRQG